MRLPIKSLSINNVPFILQEGFVDIEVRYTLFTMGNVPEEDTKPRISVSMPHTIAHSKLLLKNEDILDVSIVTDQRGEITGELVYFFNPALITEGTTYYYYTNFGGVIANHNIFYREDNLRVT